jgi:hypothetical protein
MEQADTEMEQVDIQVLNNPADMMEGAQRWCDGQPESCRSGFRPSLYIYVAEEGGAIKPAVVQDEFAGEWTVS